MELSVVQMVVLQAQYNQFQGPIPGAFDNLRNLYSLRLDKNQLEGNPPGGLLYLQDKPDANFNFTEQASPGFSCDPFRVSLLAPSVLLS